MMSLVLWRQLTPLGGFAQCLLGSPVDMLARLTRLFRRENGERRETRDRPEEAGPQSLRRPSRRRWFWGRHRTAEEPAQPPLPAGQQVNEEVKNLTMQLQLMTQERDELRDRLASITNGGASDSRPYHRLNTDLERMKMERILILSDLRKMKIECIKASEMCKKQAKETDFFRNFHSRLLSEQTQLKGNVDKLAEKNRKLLEEQNRLQRCLEDMKVFSEGDQENRLEAHVQRLLKQKEQLIQQRDLAVRLQEHFVTSEKRIADLKQQLIQAKAQKKTLVMEKEWLLLEMIRQSTKPASS